MSRHRDELGVGLIELMVAVALFGTVVVSAGGLMHESAREAARASAWADARSARWEVLRRLRGDVARAGRALALQGQEGTGLELSLDGRRVLWISREGLLSRTVEDGPRTGPVRIVARLAVESEDGRSFVRYEFEDLAGGVKGRVPVGTRR